MLDKSIVSVVLMEDYKANVSFLNFRYLMNQVGFLSWYKFLCENNSAIIDSCAYTWIQAWYVSYYRWKGKSLVESSPFSN